MRVAAYQAPLLAVGSFEAIELIRERAVWCEGAGVPILCCPEAIAGGLADYDECPSRFAIRVGNGELASLLAPLASAKVAVIVGFTEIAADGALFNTAAVFQQGKIAGLYRKRHPAIRRSVYQPGEQTPVFQVGELTFGIVICNDSNYAEPAQSMVACGARALFIPSNNGLPRGRAYPELVEDTRAVDRALARENRVWVIRADVAGDNGELKCCGTSAIVSPDGVVVREAVSGAVDTIVADID